MTDQDLMNLVPRQTVSDWARYAVERFQEQLNKKKIGVTGALFRSFTRMLEMNGGDVGAVMIKFAMYGRFIDMGVGNGVKAYERKTNRANTVGARAYGANVSYVSRAPKKWYSKTKTAESLRLQEILMRDLGQKIPAWIGEQWSASGS
ncbi:hypothetical protein FAZ19_19660 [Sphingobacterium alkalisoli]|uniref:Uncharacterized protein n=1 Tax=Sphingobacterium alkalisoli TaxID=1874115 RepID=A0A4U0GUN0_9SPHI|nr:hypothetical protein [Sphingobacterium alkalisoli]TJY62688.1 hypothetical protein FAZ19_19660 [Sphingobacterium alkalisoli]GGH28224.1 hypothetical protein GCM10011418_38720 [Sphingobacterium alkalisoli]